MTENSVALARGEIPGARGVGNTLRTLPLPCCSLSLHTHRVICRNRSPSFCPRRHQSHSPWLYRPVDDATWSATPANNEEHQWIKRPAPRPSFPRDEPVFFIGRRIDSIFTRLSELSGEVYEWVKTERLAGILPEITVTYSRRAVFGSVLILTVESFGVLLNHVWPFDWILNRFVD